MLSRLTIQNYQSLHDVRLTMGRFTALVGRSSSGKSAVVRALQLLAHNARGTSYVTEGQTLTTVAADFGDHTIAVRRGKGTSEYVVGTGAMATEKFTKCGTTVPEQVAALMSFAEVEGTDLNFSGQFDAPFLLDVPGSKVAKVLGDLTQVNLLYEASREANRRRREVTGKVKSTGEEVARLRETLQQYRDLPQEAAVITSARQTRDAVAQQAQTADDLRAAAERAERVEGLVVLLAEKLDGLPEFDTATLDRLLVTAADADAYVAAADAYVHTESLVHGFAEILDRPRVSGEEIEKVAALATEMEELRQQAEAAEFYARADALCAERIEAFGRTIAAHEERIEQMFKDHGCPLCERPWA